jgi:hypothetical protein
MNRKYKITIKSLNELKEDSTSEEVFNAINEIKLITKYINENPLKLGQNPESKIIDWTIEGGQFKDINGKYDIELSLNKDKESIYIDFVQTYDDNNGDITNDLEIQDITLWTGNGDKDYSIMITDDLDKDIQTIINYINK